MHIITIVSDGGGHTRISATRAPDLFRRQVAQETGEAHLIWCCVAPPQVGPHAFVERVRCMIGHTRTAGASYKLSPTVAVRYVRILQLVFKCERMIRQSRRCCRFLIASLRVVGRVIGSTTSFAVSLRFAVRQ